MKFLSFLVSRIGKALVVVLGVVIINFFDPARARRSGRGAGRPGRRGRRRIRRAAARGLWPDQPLPTQLMLYLKGVAQLDLGFPTATTCRCWT